MPSGRRTILLAVIGSIVAGAACAKPRAADPKTLPIRRFIADPKTFPDYAPIEIVASLSEHGAEPVPIHLTIGDTTVEFRAVAYEEVYDPFVVMPGQGRVTMYRRGIVAWRGDPARDVVALSARTSGPLERPSLYLDPSSAIETLFAQRRAYRVERDTTRWMATEGTITLGKTRVAGRCHSAPDTSPWKRQPRGCAHAAFDVSFQLVFEKRDPALDDAQWWSMKQLEVPAVPFRGVTPLTISLMPTRIPAIRFSHYCGRRHGAANDSTCLQDPEPSP